jgi:hypothetical protein
MKHNLIASLLIVAATCAAQAQTKQPPASTLTNVDQPFVPNQGIDPNELPVDVVNKSTPVLCAEKDNVHLDFVSPKVRQFRIQASHPSYINTIVVDRFAPDFTSCDMTRDPSFKSDNSRRVTFWETPEFWLVGYTFPSFWRPATVPVRVGNRVEQGLHLVQLWMRYRERAEEVLVFYPPDGYWRARPLPFGEMRWTAYGSSFLVGPVEIQDRPIVALKEVAFDPATKTFTLQFARGGSATLKLTSIDQERIVLDGATSGPMPDNLPFMAMRSMYATEFNSDVAKLAWRNKGVEAWGESNIMPFKSAAVTELWAGRTVPSIHNLSAPDMIFSHFSDEAAK